MRVLIIFSLLISFKAFPQSLKPFTEKFYLITSKCSTTFVEMNSGILKNSPADDVTIVCDSVKGKGTLKCTYLYKDGSMKSLIYDGGIIGSDGILTMKNVEQYNINMVTKKFQSDSYAYLDNGRIRGMKICGGDFLYESDFKRLSGKTKK